MSEWKTIADNLRKRDAEHVDEINGFFGGGSSLIDNRLGITERRAYDALGAILIILEHLDKQAEGE